MLTEFSSTDCDELSDSLPNTAQTFRQAKPGSFFGRWLRLELPGVTIVDNRLSHAVHTVGHVGEGHLDAMIPIRQPGTLVFEGHGCEDRQIYLGQPGTSHNISLPSDYQCYGVEFDLRQLRRTATALGMSLTPRTADNERLPLTAACVAARKLAERAFCSMSDRDCRTPQERADQFITGWLDLFRQAFSKPEPVDRSTLVQRRRAALDVANYVRTHLCDDLSLADLCEVAGVTDRTLRTGFHDVFGMSPKRWLKVERLSAARRELKAADPERVRVRTIARKYGFAQFAHFATDYRKHFGERPSETLGR